MYRIDNNEQKHIYQNAELVLKQALQDMERKEKMVILDTCTFMEQSIELFSQHVKQVYGAKLHITFGVIKELGKHMEKGGEKAELAKKGLEIIRELSKDGIMDIIGREDSEMSVDQEILTLFTMLRADKELLLITQDKCLAADVIALNKLKSVLAKPITVKKLNSYGFLSPVIKEESSENKRLPICICVDTNETAEGEGIVEINRGVQKLLKTLMKNFDEYDVDIAMLAVGDRVNIVRKFNRIHLGDNGMELRTGGRNPMHIMLEKANTLIKEQIWWYEKQDMEYLTPWLIVISNGQGWDTEKMILQQMFMKNNWDNANGNFSMVRIQVGNEPVSEELGYISTKRKDLILEKMDFHEFSNWMKANLRVEKKNDYYIPLESIKYPNTACR